MLNSLFAKIKFVFFPIVVLLLSFSNLLQAQDLPFQMTHIAPLKLKGLKQWQGFYLTAYYAAHSVSNNIISADPNMLNLLVIRSKQESLPITGDTVGLPMTSFKKINTDPELIKANIYPAYTMIVFVIHKQSQFTWINSGTNFDERLPLGLKDSGVYSKSATTVIRREDVRAQNAEFVGATAPAMPALEIDLSNMVRIMPMSDIEGF
jgi:hypothetical protein